MRRPQLKRPSPCPSGRPINSMSNTRTSVLRDGRCPSAQRILLSCTRPMRTYGPLPRLGGPRHGRCPSPVHHTSRCAFQSAPGQQDEPTGPFHSPSHRGVKGGPSRSCGPGFADRPRNRPPWPGPRARGVGCHPTSGLQIRGAGKETGQPLSSTLKQNGMSSRARAAVQSRRAGRRRTRREARCSTLQPGSSSFARFPQGLAATGPPSGMI